MARIDLQQLFEDRHRLQRMTRQREVTSDSAVVGDGVVAIAEQPIGARDTHPRIEIHRT